MVDVLRRLEGAGIEVVVDGGWGVDALLRETTRAHEDLDIVVDRRHLDAAAEILARLGFRHDPSVEPGLPARFVVRDERGRQVDVHPVTFDTEGNGWQQLSGRAWGLYPASGFATGSIGGKTVRCTSAEVQLRHHLGYEWSEKDRRDMVLLRDRFGVALPPGIG